MSNPLVSIIIINWNGGEVFENCLKSLTKITYPNWELIVVDNGSSDGSEKLPDKYKIKHTLIRNNKNIGFAPANNQGVEVAKGKYILLLNNDTIVSSNFLEKMVNFMEENPKIGAMQPKLFIMDKDGYIDNAGTYLTRTGFLEHWGYMQKDGLEFANIKKIFSAKGACLLTRKEIIDKIGLFDNDFFAYYEESDFCFRVWMLGYEVVYYPGTCIYHKVGFTSKKINQILINYHSLKNVISSMIKNYEVPSIILIGGAYLTLINGLAFYYLIRLRFSQAFMVWRAIGWNIINISKILNKRAKIQRFRKVADKLIFKEVMHKVSISKMVAHFLKVEANFDRK